MTRKAISALFLVCVLLLASLLLVGWLAKSHFYQNRMLAIPKIPGAAGLSVKALDEANGENFLLTYEERTPGSAEALHSQHEATIVRTNYLYASIMRFSMLEGSFFTEHAQTEADRFAVLGKTAAHRMFGSTQVTGELIKLAGESYTVVGVLDDREKDDSNIYIPATCSGGSVQSLVVDNRSAGVTGTWLRSDLKSLGVQDSAYYLLDLDFIANMIRERILTALIFTACFLLLFVMRLCIRRTQSVIESIQADLEHVYLPEALKQDPKRLVNGLCCLAGALASPIAAVALLSKALAFWLGWSDYAKILRTVFAGAYEPIIKYLKILLTLADCLSAAFVIAGAALIFLFSKTLLKQPEPEVRYVDPVTTKSLQNL